MYISASFILLQSIIDPTEAVNSISTNYGLLGSMFILVLALLVFTFIYIRKDTKTQIQTLNDRLDAAEKETLQSRNEAKESRKEFMLYLQNKNDIFINIIKEYADSRDKSSLLMEKILLKS
ncbi:MAG: hypothetical protein L3J35_03645 [Bacteroidales bacterium]|nr:hypothetical protein [Bacteroidales bacterium]